MKKYELIENKQVVGTVYAKNVCKAKEEFMVWFKGEYKILCNKKKIKVILD